MRRPLRADVDGGWTYVLSVPGDAPIAVLLADAHPATLAGLRASLADDRFRVVAEVGDVDELAAAAARERPDVCLIDAELPGGAVGATARISRELPGTAVVLLAEHRDDGAMFEAVRAGAAGFLLKGMDPERLRFAIRGVTEGEAALPRKLVTRLMEEFRGRDRGRSIVDPRGLTVELTSREWETLELLADGASTAEVAATLAISPVTVRRHVSAATAKLGVATRAEAIAAITQARQR